MRLPDPNAAAARTRVFRGSSAKGPWEMWRRTPLPALQSAVIELWAGFISSGVSLHRVLPNGEVSLMLLIGAEQRLTERDGVASDARLRDGYISGLQEKPATFVSEGMSAAVSARLTPLGAYALLDGLPQAELVHGVYELGSVLPKHAGLLELRERMHEVRELGVALDLLEAWLTRRQRDARPTHAAVRHASSLLRARPELTVAALARECGVSARRLHELFVREVGLPAKRIARIARFRRGLERILRAPSVDLREHALALGYYDQAHLYRDFRELACLTPLEYLGLVHAGLDGPDVIGD